MSLQSTTVSLPPSRPAPIYDPTAEDLSGQFVAAHGGTHVDRFGRTTHPRRPFHPTKCAFMGADVVAMAASRGSQSEAFEFIEALLDVVEDQLRGQRPIASALDFVVNTGTPADGANWIFTVSLRAPFVAKIRLVRPEREDWQYSIERVQSTRIARRRDTQDGRPLHPRRRREDEPDVDVLHPGAQPTVLYPAGEGPVKPGERFLDL